MSELTRHIADRLIEGKERTSGGRVSRKPDELAIFGLLPEEPSRPCDPLFARDVQTAESNPEDWVSIHLNLL